MTIEPNLLEKVRAGDLAGQDLSRSNWAGSDVSGARLAGVNLSRGKFRKANFSGADLSGADLSKADLRQTNLTGANLRGAKLEKADLDGADLTGATLDEATLVGAKVREAKLENVRGEKSAWRDALASKSRFANVDFAGADFTGADLVETTWEGARLGGAYLERSIWINAELADVNAQSANATDIDFFLSQIRDCDFSGGTLIKSNWSSTRLERVDFRGANLAHAQFSGGRHEAVEFADAALKGAILKSVKGYDEAALIAFRERGAKTSSLLWLRVGRTLRTSRLAQAAVAVIVASVLAYGWLWYRDPANWSYTRLEQAAGDAVSKQDVPRAIRHYELILAKYPDDPFRVANIRVQLANLYLGQNKIDDARRYFDLVVAGTTDRPELKASLFSAELGLADALAQERRYEKSVAAFASFAERWNAYPESSRAWERIAQIEVLRGDVEAAEAAYMKIVGSRQFSSDAIFNANLSVARLWKEHGQGPKAIARLDEVLAQNVDIPQRAAQVLSQQIEVFVSMGDLEGAQAKLALVKERYADQTELILAAENAIADGEKNRGTPELAVARYERLLESAKEPVQIAGVASSLSAVLTQIGRFDDALKVLDGALERVKSVDEQAQRLTIDRVTVLLAARRLDEAAKILEGLRETLKDAGARNNAAIMLAGVYRNRGEHEKARELLNEVLADSEESPHMQSTIRQTLGDIAWELGDANEAVAQYRRVSELTTDLNLNFNPDLNIVNVYRQSRNLTEWKKQIELMAKRYVGDPVLAARTRSEEAEYLRLTGDVAGAEAIWNDVAKNPQADVALGALRSLQMLYADQGRIADLDVVAKTLADRFPTRTDDLSVVRLAKAESLARARDFDAALAEFRAIVESAPPASARQAYSRIMDIEAQRGNLDAVRAAYDRAIAIPTTEVGGRAQLIQKLANAIADSGRFPEALSMLEAASAQEKEPREQAQLMLALAGFHDRGASPDAAINAYESLIGKYAGDGRIVEVAQARFSLGQLLERKGDLAGARKHYETLIATPTDDGTSSGARTALVRVMVAQGQLDAATTMIAEVRAKGPGSQGTADAMSLVLGESLARTGKLDLAVRALEPLTAESELPALRKQALIALAQAYSNAREWEKARRAFEAIAKDYSDDEVASDQARMGIAWTLKSEDRRADAVAAYEKAAKAAKSPESRLNALTELISLAVDAGDAAAVAQLAGEIGKDFANRPDALAAANSGLAQIAGRAGRIDDAVAAWRKNLDLALPANAQFQVVQQIVQAYVQADRTAEAEKLLTEMGKRFPGDFAYQSDVKTALAQLMSATGRADEAAKLLGGVVESANEPGRKANVAFQLAQLHRQNNRFDDALRSYDDLLKNSGLEQSLRDQATAGRAETLRQARRFDEAVAAFLAIAEKGTTAESREWALGSAAQCYAEQNRFDDAVKLYRDLLARADGAASAEQAHYGLSNALKQAGRTDEALATLEELKKATTDPAKSLRVDVAIARLHQDANRPEEAAKIFRAVSESNSADAVMREEATWELAQSLRKMRALDDSLALFRKLAKDSKSPETRRQSETSVAQILAEMGDVAAAKDAFDKLIAAETDAAEKARLSTELGGIFQQSNRPKDAQAAYRRAVELAPRSLTALWATQSLAQIALNENDLATARKYFEQMLASPTAQESARMNARFGLADVAKRSGKIDDAIAQYQTALKEAKNDSDRAHVRNMLAQAFIEKKKPEDARAIYQAVIDDAQAAPIARARALIGLGHLLRSSGEEAKARAAFLSAANVMPKDPSASEAIQAAIASDLETGDIRGFEEHLALLRERFPGDRNAADNVLQQKIEKHRERQQWDEALASLETLLAQTKDPERRRWAHFTKGQSLSGLGRYDEARTAFQAIEDAPDADRNTILQARIGQAHNELARGDDEAAADILLEIAKKFPDAPQSVVALFDLAQIRQQEPAGDVESVFRAILSAKAAKDQDLINAHMGLASHYAQRKMVSSAVKEYQTVFDTWPDRQDTAWALSSAAMLLKDNGDQSQAVRLLERLIAKFPPEHEAVIGAKQTLSQIYKR
ncbi:MAG: tetratricopeptide repeat protein [Deltaproteobacteria bacterium]|nr:tetratricopeptide repeat protein [Deltaproteobacteria bacterium]